MTSPIPPDLERRLEMIAERVLQRYISSGPLRNASSGPLSITEGQVRMKYPDDLGGGTAVYFGPIYSVADGSYQGTGFLVQAPDGTDLVTFRTDEQFGTTMQNIYDSNGRVIFGNDAASAQGLARPYLPGAFYPTRYADMTVSTPSGTFETLFAATIHKQLPRLAVGVTATMDTTGATGELRVLVNGVQLGTTVSASFVIAGAAFGPVAVAGAHMATLQVEIQGRRTSASGALRIMPNYLVGMQS